MHRMRQSQRFRRDEKAQAFTLEGITAALLILIVTYTLFESSVVVSPIWSEYGDIQLKQLGYDILRSLDVHRTNMNLSACPDTQNVTRNSLQYMLIQLNASNPQPNRDFLNALDAMLDPSIKKRVEVYWVNMSNNNTIESLTIINNTPIPDAVGVSRSIVLYPCEITPTSPFYGSVNDTALVVEVRMILWYV
ncbi:hypothetical protein DRP07_09790 [Archaeoglobales archaeon]|nr:MAG: hypothetical protein DRP07_09790 [Archaeoglobales archaeon]